MGKSSERLATLQKKQEQLTAQIEKLAAVEKTRAKKQDLRRKILVGAYVISEAEKNGGLAELYQKMDGFVKRGCDRVLFDLPPLEAKVEKKVELE